MRRLYLMRKGRSWKSGIGKETRVEMGASESYFEIVRNPAKTSMSFFT